MSLGIPAITIGRGGPGGRTHSLDEWTDVQPAANIVNIQRALALLLAADRRRAPVIRSASLMRRPR